MSLASASIVESTILDAAASTASSTSSVGTMGPLSGFGVQGAAEFRGETFRAHETRSSFRARSSEMLGVTDKSPWEKVWYECDFIDILHGASILTLSLSFTGSILSLSQELISNGETVHKARALISGGILGESDDVYFRADCSDGSVRIRRLRIRLKVL